MTAGAINICAAVGADGVRSLDLKLSQADSLARRIELITGAIEGRLAFSTSLGIEDQAITHAIAQSRTNVDVFTLDTGRLFPETIDTHSASERHYGITIRVLAPDAARVEALVARDGILGFRNSIEGRKSCCYVRKVLPLKRVLAGASGWITGLRREQSAGRAEIPFAAWDAEHGLIKLNPIADWPLKHLEDYANSNGIPLNPLHARGFPSIGCQPCTRPIRPGEDLRAGRWWWENDFGQECGLHNRPRMEAAV